MLRRCTLLLQASLLPALWLTGCQSGNQSAQKLPRVQVEQVAEARFSDSIDTVSTLESAQVVQLAAQASGRIVQLLARQGDAVRKGQVLLVLDQAQLLAEVASLRGQMQTSKLNYERYSYLVKQGAASALQRDEYRQAFIAARESLAARQADLAFKVLRAPIAGRVTDLRVKAGDVIQAGSPLTTLIGNSALLARIDVPATVADRVRPGLPVQLLDPINQTPLAQGAVDSVDPGVNAATQSVLVKAGFSQASGEQATGALQSGELRNGLRVRTRLILGSEQALAVPFTAVSQLAGQSFVYVVGSLRDLERRPGRANLAEARRLPPGTRFAIQTPVRLGPLQGDRYPVVGGVQAGQKVIVTGLLNLRHGAPVKTAHTR